MKMNGAPSEWGNAISTLGGQLVEALKPVAAKLGVAAEHMYGVMVRQSLVDGISGLVGWLVFAAFVMYAGYRMRGAWSAEKNWAGGGDKEFMLFMTWAFQGVAIAMIAISLSAYLPMILNPEYGAIKTLLDSVKSTSCPR